MRIGAPFWSLILFAPLLLAWPFGGMPAGRAAQVPTGQQKQDAAAASGAAEQTPGLDVVDGQLAPGQEALIMEPGPVALRIRAPGARRAWLYYQPDAGEMRRYFFGELRSDAIFHWNLDTATGGRLYVASEDGSGQLTYSVPLRVVSGSYDALQRAVSPDPHVRIEVNLPAFELALYRDNLLLRRFRIGIGTRTWPVPPGLRVAREIVWNPEWMPPDSPWATAQLIRKLRARGEVLGRVKIPLGGEILIHGTSRRSDLGRLVSHGCIRMLNRDLLQLASLLTREADAPVSAAKIWRAQRSAKFSHGVVLPRPILVVIRYDPIVLRAGQVAVYRDVYGWAPVRPEQVEQTRAFADPPVAPARARYHKPAKSHKALATGRQPTPSSLRAAAPDL